MTEPVVWAVVPAAGRGHRMGADIPKQYLPLAGKAVLQHTLEVLCEHPRVHGVLIALSADDEYWPRIADQVSSKVATVTGGAERCHSVLAGIDALIARGAKNDWVMVHDAARPCLRPVDIDRMIEALIHSTCGGILAAPVRDTLKHADERQQIDATIDRRDMWHALTPQMFRVEELGNAIRRALDNDVLVTDEAQAVEAAGGKPQLVEGSVDNIKITHPADLELAEMYLKAQGRG